MSVSRKTKKRKKRKKKNTKRKEKRGKHLKKGEEKVEKKKKKHRKDDVFLGELFLSQIRDKSQRSRSGTLAQDKQRQNCEWRDEGNLKAQTCCWKGIDKCADIEARCLALPLVEAGLESTVLPSRVV